MSVAFAGESYWTVDYPDPFLWSMPSTEYPYLERMPYGSEVKMISDDTDLAHVYYNGQYGYKCRYVHLSTVMLVPDVAALPHRHSLVRPIKDAADCQHCKADDPV